jgi:hypothetical protein
MAVMNRVLCHAMLSLMVIAVVPGLVGADAAPIAGTVKSVDPATGTFVVQSRSKGKTREVVIHMRPASKIVRFVRSTDATKPGFNEQPAALADLKAGWTVSVKTNHEGDKEVAELVKVVHEQ